MRTSAHHVSTPFASAEERTGDLDNHSAGAELHSVDFSDRVVNEKEDVIERITRNFYLKKHTQSFRARVLEASDEAARASDRITEIQRELERWKTKCIQLQRKVKMHESTIASLQSQDVLKFPLLLHETMQSLQRVMSSDEDVELHVSNQHLERHNVDANDDKVYEYEQQIAQLYEELREGKQKNDMLRECLLEQKQAKSKLMKACKFARKEIEAHKHSGLDQLLNDMETKCQALEVKNSQLEQEMMDERAKVQKSHNDVIQLKRDIEMSQERIRQWEESYHQKEDEVEALRIQVREQQQALEHFQQDYDLKSIIKSETLNHLSSTEADQAESVLIMRALQRERQRVAELEMAIEAHISNQGNKAEDTTVPSPVNQEDRSLELIWRQVSSLCTRLYHLRDQLKTYNYAEALSLFNQAVDDVSTADLSSDPRDLEAACDQCHIALDTIENLIEQFMAHELGNNCAMQ